MDAIALGKQVVVLDHDVNRELQNLTRSDRLHLVSGFPEMREKVVALMEGRAPQTLVPKQRSWRDVAEDYARALTELVENPVNIGLLRRRWDLMKSLEAYQLSS
jgi:hypothetical protein